eukprot:4020248-Pleurochrysis_carterae.AAC.1
MDTEEGGRVAELAGRGSPVEVAREHVEVAARGRPEENGAAHSKLVEVGESSHRTQAQRRERPRSSHAGEKRPPIASLKIS